MSFPVDFDVVRATNISDGENTAQHRTMAEENERLKAQLFSLLQPPGQISEFSMKQRFSSICSAVDTFIANVVADSEVTSVLSERQGISSSRRSLMKKMGLQSLALGEYEKEEELVLSLAIQRQLEEWVFRPPYPHGLSKRQKEVLTAVTTAMDRDSREDGRLTATSTDIVFCPNHCVTLDMQSLSRARWRSEAIKALTSDRKFEKRQTREFKAIYDTSKGKIKKCFHDRNAFTKYESSLRKDIFYSAMKLHQDMRSVIYRYEVRRVTLAEHTSSEWSSDACQWRDMDTWTEVLMDDRPNYPLCCLYPGLVRMQTATEDSVTLVRPLMLVDLSPATGSPAALPRPSQGARSCGPARPRSHFFGPLSDLLSSPRRQPSPKRSNLRHMEKESKSIAKNDSESSRGSHTER